MNDSINFDPRFLNYKEENRRSENNPTHHSHSVVFSVSSVVSYWIQYEVSFYFNLPVFEANRSHASLFLHACQRVLVPFRIHVVLQTKRVMQHTP